ncbi:DUF3566 domain-containing protein [Mycobacterium sp. Y57]|uniref:DUF3566 domain-containing protein n=1 Tax=Mycolicibacterium xanthum TaxID=2796469 RepID=UPI001C84C5F9|nr:DUF3566 domain-containing protein [Mycolicibacterium xanthum]MBX7433747.1 DUF3566 domain-containing protein [Mycolicibacterium xanthum]
MSSPNEPANPRSGDGSSGANGSPGGSATSAGPATEGASPGTSPARSGAPGPAPAQGADGDAPPWQRGTAARRQQTPEDQRGTGAAGGLDARLNRFISGGAAPAAPTTGPEADQAPRGDRTEVMRSEPNRPAPRVENKAYASELPDLSGPMPRPVQQRKPPERPQGEQQSPATPPPAKAVEVATRQHKGPVRASMQIRRIDPWSTLKVSLLLSVALFFVWMIAVAFLYLVLGGMGVWSKLNSNVGDLLTSASGASGGELVSSGMIFGGATLIGLVNIVLLTAAATIGAFIYNLTTDLVGGIEVTLADRD